MNQQNIDSALIKKIELFSNLPESDIKYIVSRSGVLNLQQGESLFLSGQKASQFYLLLNGTIRIFNTNTDGSEDEVARFTGGDTIGDFDFARGAEYDAAALAAEDSQLIVFPAVGFTMDTLALEEPGIVCSILRNSILMMTGRIKSVNRLVVDKMSWVQDIHRQAYEDSGTGLWKQTLIKDEIIKELKNPSALIMIKPDRFKILVDSRGHSAGDEAMVKIALIMKKLVRISGNGWALRFKSNEVGLILSGCNEEAANKLAEVLAQSIADIEQVPASGDAPPFNFTATISWAIWPKDEPDWDTLFQENYTLLLDTWKSGGEKIIRYSKDNLAGAL